ncbi:MAG TPA: hypothetical protein DEO84_03355, partial [candidate division Zixibacteria bacterium]|nr:hypothetical protein [candidate division Zixibacteria bacterium]
MKRLWESIAIIVFIGTLNFESLGRPPDWAYCPGDINNNQIHNGIDITYGISYFNGGNVPPFYVYNDSTGDSLYLAGDVNGNCLFTISDIIFLRTYLYGGPLLQYCPYMRPNGYICPVNNNPPWDTTGVFFDPGIPDTVIIGNLDGSLIAAHPGDTLFIPIWLKNDQSVAAMILPIGTSDVYFSSRLGGIINSPLTRFGAALFLNPESSQPIAGFTTQTLSCWAVEHRDSLLNTLGIYKQVAEIRAVVTGDSSTIGDTTLVIQGFHPRVGLITMSDSVGLNEWNPVVIPGKVYICPSICNIPDPNDFHTIFGNRDGSAMSVRPGDTINVPVWGATSPDSEDLIDSVTIMHIPLASNDAYIVSRLGGYFPDTLVGRWDDRSFLIPDPNSPSAGKTSQSMLGLAWLTDPRDPENFFYTGGDTVLICMYRMVVTSNQAYGGQTICPFQQGHNNANGGLYWMMQDGLSSVVPTQTYGCLYFDSTGQPSIVSTAPSRNILNALTNSNISVTFDFPINLASLTDSTFVVNASMTGLHRGMFSLSDTGMTATLNPDDDFKPGEVVTVTLTPGISSIYHLAMRNPYQWSFTVITEPNAEPLSRSLSYHAGDSLYSIYAADLDNDGDIDLIASNHQTNNVSIFFNDGSGIFSFDSSYAVEHGPRSVCAVDLDGDGDMDIAVVCEHTKKITILSNNGNGVFVSATSITLEKSIFAITSGDFDRDGDMDLATALVSGGAEKRVAVLFNQENFSFTASYHQTTDGARYSMAAIDLDNGNGLDIASACFDKNKIWVSWNNGSGSFTHSAGFNSEHSPQTVCAGDIDNDGDNDLLIANSSTNYISVLENNGDSTFNSPQTYNVGSGYPYGVALSDIDGDGDLDAAVANQTSSFAGVMLNNGSGGFSADTTYLITGKPCCVVSADFNGDDKIDLAVADQQYDSLHIFLSRSILGVLSGTIRSDSALPVMGAQITIDSLNKAAYSDSAGVYIIDSLPPAIYAVSFSRPDYRDTTIAAVTITQSDTTILDVTLEELLGVIIGVVAEADSTPIVGVRIALSGTALEDTSGIDGRFAFAAVHSGTYNLTFTQPDFYDTTLSALSVTPGDTTIVNMALRYLPGTNVGRVITADSVGIEGVHVALIGTSKVDTTDAEGFYDLSGLLAGNYSITFSHADYFDTTISGVQVTPGDTVIIIMILYERPGTISGRVMKTDSIGIDSVLVTISSDGITTYTDALGRYGFNDLVAGSYQLEFVKPTYQTEVISNIIVTPGDSTFQNVILSFLPGYLIGVVTDDSLVAIPNTYLEIVETAQSDTTDSLGKYSFTELSIGTYSLFLSHQGYHDSVISDVTFIPGDTNIINIVLTAYPGVVTGTVRNVNDFAIEDVLVRALGTAIFDTTDPNGRYALSGLNHGTYSIQYSGAYYGDIIVTPVAVTPGDTTVLDIILLSSCNYTVGDANNSFTFTGLDVTYSVRYFKGGPEPPYSCNCPSHGVWYVAGDVNGSCSFTGLDITYMVRYFK